jgi:hypothetical protein
MIKPRFGYLAAAIALSVVPLAGCDEAREKLSGADACADMIEMSLGELREVRESLDNPASVEQSLRDAAEEFRAKAEDVDNAEVERAARTYADKMQEIADEAANGQAPDVDGLVQANRDLAEACA